MMPASNMKSVVHAVPHANTGVGGCHTPTADACNTKASFAVDFPFGCFLSCELLLPLPPAAAASLS